MLSWPARALPACTCSTGCGSSVSGHGSAKPVAMLVALGTGIAICDVESLQYSFSFSEELDQEWNWSEKYSAQPEILAYANHVAGRFDLRRQIVFDTRVIAVSFNEYNDSWLIETDRGDRLARDSVSWLLVASQRRTVPRF
jgi:cation diffusion facilitator CzcD-associated flavoprotein CzcO